MPFDVLPGMLLTSLLNSNSATNVSYLDDNFIYYHYKSVYISNTSVQYWKIYHTLRWAERHLPHYHQVLQNADFPEVGQKEHHPHPKSPRKRTETIFKLINPPTAFWDYLQSTDIWYRHFQGNRIDGTKLLEDQNPYSCQILLNCYPA